MGTVNQPETAGSAVQRLLARIPQEALAEAERLGPTEHPEGETPEDREARRRRQAEHRAARWMRRLPVMYATASLDDYDGDEQAQAADTATRWLESPSATLVLAGSVGTGKTHLAYAVGHALVARGDWVEAWTTADLLEALRPGGDERALDVVRSCDVLILDDLGATKVSEWAVETMTSLLDHRLREDRRQVITTNVPWPSLEQAWGGRFADRLRFRWTVANMVGESRRAGW